MDGKLQLHLTLREHVCIFERSRLEGSYAEDLTVLQRKALYFFPGTVPAIQVGAPRWFLHIHETCPQSSGHNQVVQETRIFTCCLCISGMHILTWASPVVQR